MRIDADGSTGLSEAAGDGPGSLVAAIERAVRIHREAGPPAVTLVLDDVDDERHTVAAVEAINALLAIARQTARSRRIGVVVAQRQDALHVDVLYDGASLRAGRGSAQHDARMDLVRLRLARSGGVLTDTRAASHVAVRVRFDG